MKSHPDRTQSALSRIQDLLLRNADENRGSNDQQFRLQKAVTSTAQKVLDKMAGKKVSFFAISIPWFVNLERAFRSEIFLLDFILKKFDRSIDYLLQIYALYNLPFLRCSCLLCIFNYLSSCHRTASDAKYWTIRTLFIAMTASWLEEFASA